jgi:hypothetical protein
VAQPQPDLFLGAGFFASLGGSAFGGSGFTPGGW